MKTKPTSKPKKRAVKSSNDNFCDSAIPTSPQRRSIPVAEVDKMIEAEVRRIKSQRTIFDDRNELLDELNRVKGELEYHDNLVFHYQKELQTVQAQLNEINTAIKRELDLSTPA